MMLYVTPPQMPEMSPMTDGVPPPALGPMPVLMPKVHMGAFGGVISDGTPEGDRAVERAFWFEIVAVCVMAACAVVGIVMLAQVYIQAVTR